MYRSILLPTDGSEGVERAVDHALSLARDAGADLHVLHVADTSVLPLDAHSRAAVQYMEAVAEESVAEILDRAAAAGVESTTGVVRRGRPDRVIRAYADEHDVDLIVMGTHGRTGLDHVLLGSVTERVVRTAAVPVLTVRATDTGD
jgi:nucleotide-binding universal stress UspA family protein